MVVKKTIPEPEPPRKKVTVNFVTYFDDAAIVDTAGVFSAFNDDYLDPREICSSSGLAQGEFSIEMFRVPCSLTAGEI